jgi:hypothetical protein
MVEARCLEAVQAAERLADGRADADEHEEAYWLTHDIAEELQEHQGGDSASFLAARLANLLFEGFCRIRRRLQKLWPESDHQARETSTQDIVSPTREGWARKKGRTSAATPGEGEKAQFAFQRAGPRVTISHLLRRNDGAEVTVLRLCSPLREGARLPCGRPLLPDPDKYTK